MLGCKAQCKNLELGYVSGETELETSESRTKPRYIADISGSGFLHEFALKWKQSGFKLLSLRGDSSRTSVISQSCQNMPYSLLLSILPTTTRVVWYLPHLSCQTAIVRANSLKNYFRTTHLLPHIARGPSEPAGGWLFTPALHFPPFPLQQFRGIKQAEQCSLELRLAPLQFFWSRKV